jgi:hypothetical protein
MFGHFPPSEAAPPLDPSSYSTSTRGGLTNSLQMTRRATANFPSTTFGEYIFFGFD